MGRSVDGIVKLNKCSSCGVCAGVCPRNAISMQLIDGIPTPVVNRDECSGCSLCVSVCPGNSMLQEVMELSNENIEKYCVGNYIYSEIAQTKKIELLAKTTSGGIISEIIATLLDDENGYQIVFNVKSNRFDKLICTEASTSIQELSGTEKSRYISVSQENAVRHILSHRQDKVIITGTSCAIQGIVNVIEKFHLNRDNYLLIGLFCDKLMTYHVWQYFAKLGRDEGELQELFFRDKGNGGWPGNVKIVCTSGSKYLSKKMRMQVKDLFCHPRCLYCMDKLNRYADICVGDNYTGEYVDSKGSSCVIIRTPIGQAAYEKVSEKIISSRISMKKICLSQEIEKKEENLLFIKYNFGKIKFQNLKVKLKYKYRRIKMLIGKYFYCSKIIEWFIKFDEKIKL